MKITVEMEDGKSLYDFHEVLSFLDLDDELRHSAKEDIDRMKIGHLFRMIVPKEATLFERSDAFFDLPFDELKKEILKRAPEMEGIIEKWLPKMELKETFKGKMRYAIDGLADELKQHGAQGMDATALQVYMANFDTALSQAAPLLSAAPMQLQPATIPTLGTSQTVVQPGQGGPFLQPMGV